MTIRRIHLDWTQPALPAAAGLLLSSFVDSSGDLSQVIVVIPGGRSGRRLKEILVDRAEADGVPLSPPQIITVGRLPELLYAPRRPFAAELTQRLAWRKALREFPADQLTAAMPRLPDDDEELRWLELADVLRGQHIELAADGLDFAAVAQRTSELGQTDESRRWTALAGVQRAYLDVLDTLVLWDRQTARLKAIQFNECQSQRRIVLLGMVDMNQALRRMLDQVADKDDNAVTTVIFAPESKAAAFDTHGCVIPASWENVRLAIPDDRLHVADGPVDQADVTARCLAGFGGEYRADEITIGLCDERIRPQVQRQLEECGLTARWGPGRVVAESGPFRLLAAVADLLVQGGLEQFAAVVRHPDVEEWLLSRGIQGDWLSQLDDYRTGHLQTRLSDDWYGREQDTNLLRQAAEAIGKWLAPLTAGGHRPAATQQKSATLDAWADPLRSCLGEIYAHRSLDPTSEADRLTQRGIEDFLQALADQQTIPVELVPRTTAAEAITWALDAVAGNTVAPPADPEAIELLGWLELPLDDAPALVVTSLNEGFVPKSSLSDLFLPDQLRTALGLDDNQRRYARDAYSLSMIAASRKSLAIVAGRRDSDDNPLSPSRLLLACDDETLVRRANLFFRPPPPVHDKRPLAGGLVATRDKPLFDVPPPIKVEPITSLRATDFKAYLACPYRFYLSRILGLQLVDDAAEELDPGSFGTAIHEVLKQFGDDPRRHTTSAEEIHQLLNDSLDQYLEETFGAHALAAAYVQIEQVRLRLAAFAQKQAEWADAGWRIVFTEKPARDQQYEMLVDGEPFGIRGRIDRIDRHEATGAWAVFDYKSGDSAAPPDKAHREKDANKNLVWKDLQLPLYRHLASVLEVEGEIHLGYIVLPKDVSRIDFLRADWTDAELAAADEKAAEVIRAVREQQFTERTTPPPPFAADWAAICMDDVFDKPE